MWGNSPNLYSLHCGQTHLSINLKPTGRPHQRLYACGISGTCSWVSTIVKAGLKKKIKLSICTILLQVLDLHPGYFHIAFLSPISLTAHDVFLLICFPLWFFFYIVENIEVFFTQTQPALFRWRFVQFMQTEVRQGDAKVRMDPLLCFLIKIFYSREVGITIINYYIEV